MKQLMMIILTIGVVIGCYVLLEKENEKAIQSCINAGNSQTYCEYHSG